MPSSLTPSGIAFDRAGPAGRPPVVLLHAGVADRRMWDPQWEALTAQRDAVRLDLRGFGESDRPPAGAARPGRRRARHPRPPRRRVVPPRRVLVRRRRRASRSPSPGRMPCARCCSRRPGAACSPSAPPALAAFAAAENEAMARGDLDAAVEADIDGLGRGGGTRRVDDVDPAVTASVRVMQRRAFDVEASWGDADLDEVELDPPAVERYAGGRPAGAARRRWARPRHRAPRCRPASRRGCRRCAGSTGPAPRTCRRWRSRRASSGSSWTGSPRRTEATGRLRPPAAAAARPAPAPVRAGCGGAATPRGGPPPGRRRPRTAARRPGR